MWNNRVILSGNLTKDVELKAVGDELKMVANFAVAVKQAYTKNGVDFFNCVAWGQPANYLGKYGKKRNYIQLEGQLHATSYEKDGKKVYVTEVYVDSCHLQQKIDIEKFNTDENEFVHDNWEGN